MMISDSGLFFGPPVYVVLLFFASRIAIVLFSIYYVLLPFLRRIKLLNWI